MLIKQSLGIKKEENYRILLAIFLFFNTVAKWQIIPIELTAADH